MPRWNGAAVPCAQSLELMLEAPANRYHNPLRHRQGLDPVAMPLAFPPQSTISRCIWRASSSSGDGTTRTFRTFSPPDMSHKWHDQLGDVQSIRLRPPMSPVHLETCRINDHVLDAAPGQEPVQPETIPPCLAPAPNLTILREGALRLAEMVS
jgi:hypothetical protein